ncbi:hypothetical protein F5B20DRAFT_563327 [Whalleya microplaca]|nr:hypothetical protein F5B20DRAFT_563327 [Whalleya microplaca]
MEETDHIDRLLERYLHLLHEYTSLREQLSSLQTGMYQNIARANFAAERGMRFGQDHYDERMQASRRVAISANDQDVPRFAIAAMEGDPPITKPAPGSPAPDTAASEKGAVDNNNNHSDPDGGSQEKYKESRKEDDDARVIAQTRRKDPLKWFGLLTPMALRQAQAQNIEAVEKVVPQLVSVNAEMAQVEIEVRRARKKRAKAEAAVVKKEQQQTATSTEVTASS